MIQVFPLIAPTTPLPHIFFQITPSIEATDAIVANGTILAKGALNLMDHQIYLTKHQTSALLNDFG